jgi:hypothetical protein
VISSFQTIPAPCVCSHHVFGHGADRTGVITASHAGLDDQYFDHWMKGFFMVWPIVFIVILVIAPLVSRFADALVEN